MLQRARKKKNIYLKLVLNQATNDKIKCNRLHSKMLNESVKGREKKRKKKKKKRKAAKNIVCAFNAKCQ